MRKSSARWHRPRPFEEVHTSLPTVVRGLRSDQPDFDTAQGVSHDVVLSLHVLDPGDVVLLQVQGQPAQLSRQVHFSQQPLQWLVIGLDGRLASQ